MAATAAIPIVGGIVNAMGAQAEGADRAAAATFNAQINEQNANMAIQQGAEQERQQRVYSAEKIGQERADYGASGVSGASGSALDVLQASARNAEMDALNIRHGAEMKAWSYRQGATLDNMQAGAATNAAKWSAAGAIFNGVSGAASAGAFG